MNILPQKCFFYNGYAFSLYDYPEGFAPQVGDKCLICGNLCIPVSDTIPGLTPEIPTDGLVFHAPLTVASTTAATGQTLESYGSTVTYTAKDNIPCAHFDHSYLKTTQMEALPSGNQPWTISAKLNADRIDSSTWPWALFIGNPDINHVKNAIGFAGSNGSYPVFGFSGRSTVSDWFGCSNTMTPGAWYTYTATYDGNKMCFYIKGVLKESIAVTPDVGTRLLAIGCGDALTLSNSDSFIGHIAAVRVYNRALSAAEVTALAAEIPVVPPPPPVELVYYAPLDASKAAAETGQPLTAQGTVAFATTDAVPSAVFDKSAYLISSTENLPSGDSDRTVSAWVKCLSSSSDSGLRDTFFSYGTTACNQAYQCSIIGGTGQVYISGGYDGSNECASENGGAVSTWMHVCIIHKSSVDYFYINGVAAGSFSYARNTGTTSAYVGIGVDLGQGNTFNGSIAALRVYNGAVSDAKFAELAAEFTPTTGA